MEMKLHNEHKYALKNYKLLLLLLLKVELFFIVFESGLPSYRVVVKNKKSCSQTDHGSSTESAIYQLGDHCKFLASDKPQFSDQ